MSPSRVPAGAQRGPIMAVGGAVDRPSHSTVLQHFWSLAGSYGARIVILPVAAEVEDVSQDYVRAFKEMEPARVTLAPLSKREDAINSKTVAAIEGATAVLIIGGNALRLASVLGGTPTAQLLRRMNARGVLVGGASAGASVLTEHMVVYGQPTAEGHHGMVNFAPGLGLSNRLMFDQHFAQHYRFGRLMEAVAHNPFLLGVGLDEDTAVVLDSSNTLTVVGQRGVVIVDGGELNFTDIHDVPSDRPIAMLGLRVHMLTHEYTYQVEERKASPPDPERVRQINAEEEVLAHASVNGAVKT